MKFITIGKQMGIMALILFFASSPVYGVSSSEKENTLLYQPIEISENSSFLSNIALILKNRRLRTSSRFNQTQETRTTLDTTIEKEDIKESAISVKKTNSSLYSILKKLRDRKSLSQKTSSITTTPSSTDYLNYLKSRNIKRTQSTTLSQNNTITTTTPVIINNSNAINNVSPQEKVTPPVITTTIRSTNNETQSLSASRTDSFGNSMTISPEQNNIKILKFSLHNPNSVPIDMSGFQFVVKKNTNNSFSNYGMKIFSNETMLGNTSSSIIQQPSGMGLLTITGLNHFQNSQLPANGNREFTLIMDQVNPPTTGSQINFKLTDIYALNPNGGFMDPINFVTPIESPQIETVSLNASQSIKLAAGWNTISLNVNPLDTDIESVFSEIISAGNLVQVKDVSHSFDPNLPGFLNTLNTIEGAKGYTVKVSKESVLTVEGDKINVPYTYNLNAGWNLIGYPGTIEVNALCAVHEVFSEDSDMVLKDNFGKFVKDFNPHPQVISRGNGIGNLKPGQGYWMQVTNPGTFSITADPADAVSDITCLNRY
jgi:hypothetical protein